MKSAFTHEHRNAHSANIRQSTAIRWNMSIRILLTGGTFDKEYNELDGTLFFRDTHLPEILKLGRNLAPVQIRTLMMVDSLDMTEADRNAIAQNVLRAEEDKLIVTHGTDTMVETAKSIARVVRDKTVVLVGAMIPYKFGSSDGLFNFGAAIAFAQTLPYGVYIAMNGRYFNYDNCRKNKKTGVFEEIKI